MKRRGTDSARRYLPRAESLEDRSCPSIVFKFDYSLDTSGFFNVPERRAALQRAGDALGRRLQDQLAAITPTATNTWNATFFHPVTGSFANKENLNVPANTLVVFAGGRNLPGAQAGQGGPGFGGPTGGSPEWNDLVFARGQAGMLADSGPTDYAIWGGSISFDTTGTAWHFGATTSGLAGKIDFYSVALHELGHMIGFGTAPTYDRYVTQSLRFTGPQAVAAYGTSVPLANYAHLAGGIRSGGAQPAMSPVITAGTRKNFTKLDWAVLSDIGWTVGDPPTPRNDVLRFKPGSFSTTQLNVLANDLDPVGSGLQLSIVANPTHGIATINNNGTPANFKDDTIAYQPNPGFFGADTFTYKVVDGKGASSQATVTVSAYGIGLDQDLEDSTKKALVIVGSAANEILTFAPADTAGGVRATLFVGTSVKAAATYNLGTDNIGRLLQVGQAGADTLRLLSKTFGSTVVTLSTPALLDGGAGNDILSTASTGNNIAFGGLGNDTITGGTSRDILVGGAGTDTLIGASEDDVLVANNLSLATNYAALYSLMKEWAGSNDYTTRIGHLSGTSGGLNDGNFLDSSTVTDDLVADYLYGKTGTDWFLKKPKDAVKDAVTGEAIG